MTLDLTLRAQTPATLAYALKRPLMQHLGVRFPRDDDDNEVLNPDNWKPEGSLGPDIFYHYIRRNGLVVVRGTYDEDGVEITPPDLDPACFLLMRIIRAAFDADHEDDPTGETDPQPDRWRQSRLKRRIKAIGVRADWNGVRAWQHTFPQSAPQAVRGKSIQIMRGSMLAQLQIFPEFMGGGSF